VGAVAVLVALRRDEVGAALARVPPVAFAGLVLVHVVTLTLRSEAWRDALWAVAAVRPSRRAVHGANAAAFVAGSVAAHLALPARAVALRRLDPARAPRMLQVIATDAPIAVVEAVLTALLLVACVALGGGSWLRAALAAAGSVALLALARWLLARFRHRPIAHGLAILGDRRRRGRFVLLLAAVQLLGAGRALAALALCGVPVGPLDAGPVHAALGAAGLLPIGVAASPAGVAAATGAADGAVLAAGLVIAASSVAAVLVYGTAVAALATRR